MTRTITPLSGPSLDASPSDSARSGDPYLEITDELHRLLTRKRNYYGCADESPLENAMAVEFDGIHPVTYQMARVGEKLRRLRGLMRTMSYGQIRETLIDIAGHAVVAMACLDEEKKE